MEGWGSYNGINDHCNIGLFLALHIFFLILVDISKCYLEIENYFPLFLNICIESERRVRRCCVLCAILCPFESECN